MQGQPRTYSQTTDTCLPTNTCLPSAPGTSQSNRTSTPTAPHVYLPRQEHIRALRGESIYTPRCVNMGARIISFIRPKPMRGTRQGRSAFDHSYSLVRESLA